MYSATAGFLPESMILVNFGVFFLVFEKKNDKITSKTAAVYIISSMLVMDLQLVIVELLSQDIPTTNAFQRNSRQELSRFPLLAASIFKD